MLLSSNSMGSIAVVLTIAIFNFFFESAEPDTSLSTYTAYIFNPGILQSVWYRLLLVLREVQLQVDFSKACMFDIYIYRRGLSAKNEVEWIERIMNECRNVYYISLKQPSRSQSINDVDLMNYVGCSLDRVFVICRYKSAVEALRDQS